LVEILLSFLYTAAQETSNLMSAEGKDKQRSRHSGLQGTKKYLV